VHVGFSLKVAAQRGPVPVRGVLPAFSSEKGRLRKLSLGFVLSKKERSCAAWQTLAACRAHAG